jgi:hypothetical protein
LRKVCSVPRGCYAPKHGSSNKLNRRELNRNRAQPKTYGPTKILQSEAEFKVWGVKIKHKDARGNYPWSPPTNSYPKHLRIKGISHTRKTDKNSSKKTRKSNKLQAGNRRNHESFHSLGGHILYKLRKYLTLWSKEMRSCPDGWIARKP